MSIFIDGIAISGYRSFGNEIQRIGPFAKINLLVGQNNSGKSNVLLFLHDHYRQIFNVVQKNNTYRFNELDKHIGAGDVKKFEFPLLVNGENYHTIRTRFESKNLGQNHNVWLDSIFQSETLTDETNLIWFPYKVSGNGVSLDSEFIDDVAKANILNVREWQSLWSKLTDRGSGDLRAHWIPQTLETISPLTLSVPNISLIPAVRRIGSGEEKDSNDFSGIGLIDRLAKLQNPNVTQQNLKNDFETINKFLQTVTGKADAVLEIPYERDMILVHMDDKVLPLSSLGTGIHEVIILASAATVLKDQIVCIEEPELHMHPMLQKKLIQYLYKNTSNQYFISTHSAHILDHPNLAIFHVMLQDKVSKVTPVHTDSQRFTVCTDLGYRASDLLQANCIIWVEGPSDRIYLNHWIKSVEPNLIEGLHYSIMFYGGRLLRHLSANDPEIEEFISLRRLNRNISIVIDSDRTGKTKKINKTKQRVRSEFSLSDGITWITSGREIENYIPHNMLEKAVKEIHPSVKSLKKFGQFDDPLHAITSNGKFNTVDKVKIAHKVAENKINWGVLDLQKNVENLVAFIKSSNGADN